MTPETEGKARLFADLGSRILTALVLALVAVAFLAMGGLPTAVFAALFASVMLWEMLRLVQTECQLQPLAQNLMILFGSLAVLAMNYSPVVFVILVMLGLGIGTVSNWRKLGRFTVAGFLIVSLAAASFVHLRGQFDGFWLVLWIVACVAAADIGGYFFGRVFGGPKLWPAVSPKKTWSGALGGTLLTLIVAAAFGNAAGGDMVLFLAFGVVIAVVALCGDLAESSVKRRFGVKDASAILPGHGGLLDRVDGLSAVMILFFALSYFFDLNMLLDAEYTSPVLTGSGL